jgi:hypothetical protein
MPKRYGQLPRNVSQSEIEQAFKAVYRTIFDMVGTGSSGDLTEGTVPVADDQGNLIDSSITDDGSLINIGNPVNYIDMYTAFAGAMQEGRLAWDNDNGTLAIGMPGGEVILQVGLEGLIRVSNKSGSDISNGCLLYATGSQGNKLTVDLADNTDANKIFILGMATEDIADNANGWVAIWGDVRGSTAQPIDTSSFSEGDKLYLSTAGMWTNVHPTSSVHGVVVIGWVRKSHATDGIITLTNPESFTIGNEFNGTIRQSVINKSTGIAAASGFTAVNDNNHFTTMGIAGSGNTAFPNEVSIYYAPGYGDHWQAVDGNKDFVWFTDPTDSHNNSSLNYERMRLFASGLLRMGATDYEDLVLHDDDVPNKKFVDDIDIQDFFNGSFVESFNCLASSDGVTITASLEKDGGGDLTMRFSDGWTTLDCTPAKTVALTAGGALPQENFVYVPRSTKLLTNSTTGWPAEEHIKVSYFFASTAAKVQADNGTFINQNWNDHRMNSNGMGHMVHMAERERRDGAYYFSGIDGAGTDGYTTSAAGSVVVKSNAGVLYQMHIHTFPAKDTSVSDDVHVVNGHATDGGAYFETQNLYDITVDTTGSTLTNKYFSIVLWGVANKGGEYGPLMVNIPNGSYNTQALAVQDSSGYTVYDIPREFDKESSTGFLIASIVFRKTGGSWTWIATTDLRGRDATAVSGGGSGVQNEFSDNLFRILDNVDPTKEIAFEASGITTGTTRTITMADADVDLSDIATNNAKVSNVTTNLSTTQTATTVDVVSSDGTDATLPQAIAGGNAGVLSGADKTKLDGIEAGAEVNNISDANATDLTDGGETSLHTHPGGGGSPATDCAFRRLKTSDQSLSASTLTKITFGTADFDKGPNWDNTNSRFVAPTNGIYQFNVIIQWSALASGDTVRAEFHINGVKANRFGWDDANGAHRMTCEASALFELSATDYVEIFALCSANESVEGDAVDESQFSGFRVADLT